MKKVVIAAHAAMFALALGWGQAVRADELSALEQSHDTKISFVDRCSDEETGVLTPNGARIEVGIDKLVPGQPLEVTIDVYPQEGHAGKNKSWKEKVDSVDGSGEFRFKRNLKFIKAGSASTVWHARVRWIQTGSKRSAGGASTGIFVLPQYGKRFFRVTGTPVCRWETPIRISSRYFYNLDHQTMSVSWSTGDWERSGDYRGLSLGLGSGSAGSHFNDRRPMMSGGWFFFGWTKAQRETIASSAGSTQTWNLLKGQGGYLGERTSYVRVPVVEVTEDEGDQCKNWKEAKTGWLDVGRQITEFGVVPESLSQDLVEAQKFMEHLRPTLDSCTPMDPRTGKLDYMVRESFVNGSDESLFYYEN